MKKNTINTFAKAKFNNAVNVKGGFTKDRIILDFEATDDGRTKSRKKG